MLVVKIELWPHGDESRSKLLAVGTIANDGTGSPTSGNYKFLLTNANGKRWKQGSLYAFPRKRLLAWDLLYRALRSVIGERNDLTPETTNAV